MKNLNTQTEHSVSRRAFLQRATAMGAAAVLPVAGLLTGTTLAYGHSLSGVVTDGDIAILKFLAAAELIEEDLWQQYCELAVNNRKFHRVLNRIDPALVRYICDDRDDERSHANLINAFLQSIGEEPVDLEPFRTLPSVDVQGAEPRLRLTNLTTLTVDTSWYLRYRGQGNPDVGDTFPQLVDIVHRPTIPTSNQLSQREVQGIAHSAAFHFAAIEQGGGSLYNALLTKVTNLDVVAILASIGPTEVYHFAAFHKSLEMLFGLQSGEGLDFPDLRNQPALAQAIFPEPCTFLDSAFPLCSVIRPRTIEHAGAVAAATGLVESGLFAGQSPEFFDAVVALATAADAAERGF